MSIPLEGGAITTFPDPPHEDTLKAQMAKSLSRPSEDIAIATSAGSHWSPKYRDDIKQTHTLARPPDGQLVSPYPFICIGLCLIDVGIGTHPSAPKKESQTLARKIDGYSLREQIGLKATVTPVPGSFASTIGIWGNGHMSGSTCTWLSSPYLRSATTSTAGGTESIKRSTEWTVGPGNTDWYGHQRKEEYVERPVRFNPPFQGTPRVIVWISGFQIDHKPDVDNDFGGSASDISQDGFTLRFHRGEHTQVRQAQLSWFAFYTKTNQVQGGAVLTGAADLEEEGVCEKDVQRVSAAKLVRPAPAFKERPKVLQALSRFRLGSAEQGLRVKVIDPVFDEEKWSWETRAGSGSNTVLHQAEITWIAY